MTIQKLGNDTIEDRYNEVVKHPMQSYQWGEARKKLGTRVERFGLFDESSLKDVYQMTIHTIPYTAYKIGYIPKSTLPSKEFLDYLRDYGKQEKLIFIKFEPNVQPTSLTSLTPLTSLTVPSANPLFPKWTLELDLNKSEEDLLAQMKPKTRYNIRLAEKKGVYVKEMTNDEGFEIFAKLYFETCKRQNYHGHNMEYHRTIFNSLKEKMAHILIAFYEQTPLVAYELFLFNNILYYPYGGSSLEYRNFMGANLLMWETIKFGKNNGAHSFDMWGSAPPGYKDTDPWAGFTRLKEGYGSEFVEFIGSSDLVINKPVYSIYNQMYKARKLLLGIK